MKLLYTTAFGEPYISMAKLMVESVSKLNEPDLVVLVITDRYAEFNSYKVDLNRFQTIQIDQELSKCEKMAFRTRLTEFIDIKDYDQIWFADPDIIFKKNPFHLFDGTTDIKVCREIWTNLTDQREWFAKDISDELLQVIGKENGINGGFWMVPKCNYYFFNAYKQLTHHYNVNHPDDISADQQALNEFYYLPVPEIHISTMPVTIVCFPVVMPYHDHYLCHYACTDNDTKLRMMNEAL